MSLHRCSSQLWIDDVQAYIDELCMYQRERKLEVPLFFIRLLHIILQSCPISTERAHIYGVATTLLNMGLNTHIQERHQPMDVLAGDYLSIQFYCLLSKQGEVEGIRHVAKTISQINEWNMEHHIWLQQGAPYDASSLKRVQRISSALILSVASFFYKEADLEVEQWNRLIPCVFLLNEVRSAQYQLTSNGEESIRHTSMTLQEAISQLKSVQLQEELYRFLGDHDIFSLKEGAKREYAIRSR